MTDNSILAEAQSAEAQQAVSVAMEAQQKAQTSQIAAAIEASIAKFFNRGVEEKRFVDIGRIPFICDDIRGIHLVLTDINENKVTKTDFLLLKQQSDLTNKIVLGAVGFILLAVLGAITMSVFK